MWMGRILGKYLFVGGSCFSLDKCFCCFFVHIIYTYTLVFYSFFSRSHNLPDGSGNRYCINLVSVAGKPE